jgi:hypothetical protein
LAQIAAFKVKALQPAELLSTASYRPGEMIEYRPEPQKHGRLAEAQEITAEGVKIKGQLKGARELVGFNKVGAVYEKAILERGPGEVLLMTQKIKVDGKVYENGSRLRGARGADGNGSPSATFCFAHLARARSDDKSGSGITQ